jgi:hypothetical protein
MRCTVGNKKHTAWTGKAVTRQSLKKANSVKVTNPSTQKHALCRSRNKQHHFGGAGAVTRSGSSSKRDVQHTVDGFQKMAKTEQFFSFLNVYLQQFSLPVPVKK